MSLWSCVLELDEKRKAVKGSEALLCDAVRRGADLRIYTEFKYNEHIDPQSNNSEPVLEISDFPVTYLIDDCWVAGIMSQRQPINLPGIFGARPSMSFFLYNQNGAQAIACPFFDGKAPSGKPGPSPTEEDKSFSKYHKIDLWDADTNALSSNFIFDFGSFRFCVRDDWKEVLSHTEDGTIISGSINLLSEALSNGSEIKVSIKNLCKDLTPETSHNTAHEVFIKTCACWFCTEQKMFVAGTNPLVRVRPNIPLVYSSNAWDFGWMILRTDGYAVKRICNPYTLKFTDTLQNFAVRWFAR